MPHTSAARMPELREAGLDDYAAIMAIESAQDLTSRSFEDWSRLWLKNPVYKRLNGDWPIGWVLENEQGRIVGSIGNVPALYELAGTEILAATGRAWAVEPEYRSFALFLLSEFFAQSKPQLFLNTTVNNLAVSAFTSCGSLRVPVGDWDHAAYFVSNYQGFARAGMRVKGLPFAGALSFPVGWALFLKDRLTGRALPSASLRVEEATSFDWRFDELWSRLRARHRARLMGVRTSQALEWHFGSALAKRRLWIHTVSEGSDLLAYAIFLQKDHKESGLRRMRLVDFQAGAHEESCLAAILQHTLDRCACAGVHALEHVGCGLNKTRLFDAHAPYRRRLPAWPFYYQGMGALSAKLADPANWDPSSFDGDSSL